jgi:hypothetical protein
LELRLRRLAKENWATVLDVRGEYAKWDAQYPNLWWNNFTAATGLERINIRLIIWIDFNNAE